MPRDNGDSVLASWRRNQYSRPTDRHGNLAFHPAVRHTSGITENRRGGYQGRSMRSSDYGGGEPGPAGDYGNPSYRR